jgi:uncharacterized membrane protein
MVPMTFSEDVLIRIAIFVLGVCGFMVAWTIFKHKKPNQSPLVCPLKFDCQTVVHSDYSKFFGVPVEILGMLYYGFVFVSYFLLIFVSHSLPILFVGFLATLSIIAFLYSLFLIGVQIFVLKKGCFWCFISAFICILIFLLTVSAYDFSSIIGSIF